MSRARHKLTTLTRPQVLVLAAASALLVFLVGSVLWAQFGQQQAQDATGVVEQQRDEVAEQRDSTAAQAASLAEQIKAACRDGSLHGAVCEQAEQVAATPVPPVPGPIGPEGLQGPGPTVDQIQDAVAAYLLANPPPPGRAPTPAEVAAAVASFLTANPPAPGRSPTAEEISSAVATYFARNPPPAGEPGENGRDGQPGRPPTAAEIRIAVDQYLAENPPPAGEAGTPGPQGPIGPPGEPPESFTMTLDGQAQTCARSGGSDTAPAYTCSAPAGSGEDDEDDGGLPVLPENP